MRWLRSRTFPTLSPLGVFVVVATALATVASPARAAWQERPIPGLPAPIERAVAAHAKDPDVLLAADGEGDLYRTDDGGATWEQVADDVVRLAFANVNPSHVYVLRTTDEKTPLLVSHDAGSTFDELPFPQTPDSLTPQGGFIRLDFQALAIDPSRSDMLLIADIEHFFSGGVILSDSSHFWSSVDGGQSWQDFGDEATALAIGHFDGHPVYRGTVQGLRVSHTDGRTFGPAVGFPFLAGVTDIVADPFRQDGLWVVAAGGLFHSEDAGKTFTHADAGLPAGEILSLAADPSRPGILWLVLAGHGPFVSHDRGKSWDSAADGLDPSRFVGPLAVGPDGRVWAGTEDGVLRLDPGPSVCTPSDSALCLLDGRFRVEVEWRNFQGGVGVGHTHPVTGDTGAFWFFDSSNLELMVKLIDGRTINGHFWVFYGSLSNVAFTLTVTDTATGAHRVFGNAVNRFASAGVTDAFPAGPISFPAGVRLDPISGSISGSISAPLLRPAPGGLFVPCGSMTNLCLQNQRFRVEVLWHDFQGGSGVGRAVPLTSDTGAFWFFDPDNLELMVKVLDGRTINGHYWVFLGSLTNVEFDVLVTDTANGRTSTYHNTSTRFASNGDAGAFSGDGPMP